MSRKPSIIIVTSNAARHRFFANTLAGRFSVDGIISEEPKPLQTEETKDEGVVIADHFDLLSETETKYFGDHSSFRVDPTSVLSVRNGESNSKEVFEWIKKRGAELVVLFGSAIIKPPLLSHYNGKIINMHLGLAPYYRGAGTNFWPLVNNEPECVGATIHLAVRAVDAGSILTQVRPVIQNEHHNHDIGCNTIIPGTHAMGDAIEALAMGAVTPKEQNLSIGRVYRRKDFNAQSVLTMRGNFKNGMISTYLEGKPQRDAAFPIIAL